MAKAKNIPTTSTQAILANENFPSLPPPAKFAVYHFIAVWERAGCPELPSGQEFDIRGITGINHNSWRRYKMDILAVLGEVMPIVQRIHARDKEINYKRLQSLHKGWPGRDEYHRNRRLQTIPGKAPLFEKNTPRAAISPVAPVSKPYHSGGSDPLARRGAIANSAKARKKGDRTLFYDK